MEYSKALPPKALVFDLGGVLIDIDFQAALAAWSRLSQLESAELCERFAFDEAYKRHERGEISSATYFDYVASTLELHATHQEIEAGWNAVLLGEIKETLELVTIAAQVVPCYGFSNTNASHMSAWDRLCPTLTTNLIKVFASHEIGSRKPEPVSFQYVCEQIEVLAESVLFFDDLQANVEAARAVGMQAVLVRGPADVASALSRYGLTNQSR